MTRREVKTNRVLAWIDTALFDERQYPLTPSADNVFTVAASPRPPFAHARVFVRLMCQTASGGSYFALCGGKLAPLDHQFICKISYGRDRADHDGISSHVADLIWKGVQSFEQYDAGRLEIDEGVEHLVDCKPWAWERAGAVLVRLAQSDIWDLSEADFKRVILQTAAYRSDQ